MIRVNVKKKKNIGDPPHRGAKLVLVGSRLTIYKWIKSRIRTLLNIAGPTEVCQKSEKKSHVLLPVALFND